MLSVTVGTPRFPGTERDPLACGQAVRRETIAATAHESPAVRARVRRIVDRRLARIESVVAGRTEMLSVMEMGRDGRIGGGGGTYLAGGRVPAMGSVGTVRLNGHRRVRLTGIVPDGVARVRILDRDGPAGRGARPATVAVRDNVFDAILARHMGPRMTVEWRAPSGEVVRRVHPRY